MLSNLLFSFELNSQLYRCTKLPSFSKYAHTHTQTPNIRARAEKEIPKNNNSKNHYTRPIDFIAINCNEYSEVYICHVYVCICIYICNLVYYWFMTPKRSTNDPNATGVLLISSFQFGKRYVYRWNYLPTNTFAHGEFFLWIKYSIWVQTKSSSGSSYGYCCFCYIFQYCLRKKKHLLMMQWMINTYLIISTNVNV